MIVPEEPVVEHPIGLPFIQEMQYEVVEKNQIPYIDAWVSGGDNIRKTLRVTVDTYEEGYYLEARQYTFLIQGMKWFRWDLFSFTEDAQIYDLVIRLWEENVNHECYQFTIQSASKGEQLIHQQQPIFTSTSTYIQVRPDKTYYREEQFDFHDLYATTDCYLPTIDISTWVFSFSSAQPLDYARAYLKVESGFENSDIARVQGFYYFPLTLQPLHDVFRFQLMDQYFFDWSRGVMVYEENENTIESSKLILSLHENVSELSAQIVIEQAGQNKITLLIDLELHFSIQYFGNCSDSLFCIRKQAPLSDIDYTTYRKVR